MGTKQCTKCKKIKPLSEFHRNIESKDGFVSQCKDCISEYQSNYYLEHREEILVSTKEYKTTYPEKVADSNAKSYKKHRDKRIAYYIEHREKILSRGAKYKSEHPEEIATYNRDYKLQRNYGITVEEYDEMLEAQGGGCAICGKTPEENGRRLAVDHNHETDKLRGLLCNSCNSGLGYFQDKPEICCWAMLYLEEYEREVEEE